MATSEGIPSSIDIEFLELNDNPYYILEAYGILLIKRFLLLNQQSVYSLVLNHAHGFTAQSSEFIQVFCEQYGTEVSNRVQTIILLLYNAILFQIMHHCILFHRLRYLQQRKIGIYLKQPNDVFISLIGPHTSSD